MPIIKEHRRKSIGNAAVVVHIENPDNWVSLSVNGNPLTYQEGGVFTQNITSLIKNGTPNVIVLALINTYVPSFNPASVSARLEVGRETINLSESSGSTSVVQGLYSLTTVVLER